MDEILKQLLVALHQIAPELKGACIELYEDDDDLNGIYCVTVMLSQPERSDPKYKNFSMEEADQGVEKIINFLRMYRIPYQLEEYPNFGILLDAKGIVKAFEAAFLGVSYPEIIAADSHQKPKRL